MKNYNNTNITNNDDKELNLIIKNYMGNNKNKILENNNNNNGSSIFKNYSNIYKNNIKPLFRQSTSDWPGPSDLKVDLPLFLNNSKDIGNSNKKKIENIKKKDFFEKMSSSLEKQKENELNLYSNGNNNNLKSYFLMNLKYNKSNLNNNTNDLLSLKKSVYNNTKLPKLKLKLEK